MHSFKTFHWRWMAVVFLLFSFGSQTALAQSTVLLIKKHNSTQTRRINVGDYVQLVGQDYKLKGYVDRIETDYIRVDGHKLEYERIEKFIYYKPVLMANSVKIVGAGVLLLGIVTFNGLINNDDPLVDKGTAIISASAIALGATLFKLGIKNYKMNDKRYFEVLDFTNLAEPKP